MHRDFFNSRRNTLMLMTREEYLRRNNHRRVREAISVDKLTADISKAKASLESAMDAVTKAASVMYDIVVDATAIGGKVKEMVPSHIEKSISQLTDIVKNQMAAILDGNDQSSLKSIDDLVGSMPNRDLRPMSNEEEVEKISMKPNLANGPQSSVLNGGGNNNLEESYEEAQLDMSTLRESLGGDEYDDIQADDDPFAELNAGLMGGQSTADYVSPIEKMDFYERGDHLVDDSLIADEPEDGELSMDNINIPKSSGLVFDALDGMGSDDGMMDDFAEAPVTEDEFEGQI